MPETSWLKVLMSSLRALVAEFEVFVAAPCFRFMASDGSDSALHPRQETVRWPRPPWLKVLKSSCRVLTGKFEVFLARRFQVHGFRCL